MYDVSEAKERLGHLGNRYAVQSAAHAPSTEHADQGSQEAQGGEGATDYCAGRFADADAGLRNLICSEAESGSKQFLRGVRHRERASATIARPRSRPGQDQD